MTIRISTGLGNAMLGNTGARAALAGGKMNIYQGVQPADADTGATGLLLGTVTLNDDGATGLTFDAPVADVLSKAAAETWRFHGLAAGVAGWYRFYAAGGNPAATSTTESRVDGSIGTSGADLEVGNVNIQLNAITTVDQFSFQMPKS